VDQGRCRWLPDGRAIAYVTGLPSGGYAIFVQSLQPGADTTATRRRIGTVDTDLVPESMGISPDGARIAISYRQQAADLMVAEGVAGLAR
jgi:hypothetical protein